MYKLNLTQIFFLFRNTIIWIIGFIIMVIYTHSHKNINNKLLVYMTIAFAPFILPFLILFFQYLFFSICKIKISDNIILFNKNKESINKIEIVEKHQSTKKNKQDNVAYLPWMAGTFYYYKIRLKSGEIYYLTCLMDNNSSFEKVIKELNIKLEIDNEFYPWIS